MRTINGGLRATLAAIRQEREDNRRVKKELDRQRIEVHRKSREVEKEKRREAEAWLRRFTLVCTKPECFNQKQMATIQEEVKKYPGITVKLTTESDYDWKSRLPELKSAQKLYDREIKNLGAAWKSNCLKCKSLVLVMNTSGDKGFFCQNQKCLRNLLPKEKGSGSGAGGGNIAEHKANNRVRFTRNDFLRKEIVKNTTEDSSLMISIWCLLEGGAEDDVPGFLESKKLISAKKRTELEEEHYGSGRDAFIPYLVKFTNPQLHDALKFFSAKVVGKDNPFDIEQLVNLSGVVKRSLADFRVTEDYLDSMTKDELVKLAGEFKLILPKLEKKGELVKFILEREPGKAPAEITKEDYREDEEE